MKFHVKNSLFFFFLLLGNMVFAQTEFKIPSKPSKIYPINDYATILTSDQVNQLNRKLISYSDSTSTEILVCMVKTLEGDDINYVGARWGNEWGIGEKDKNNGILLLIAVDDRKLSIQTGRGTEDAMTDMMSGIIIRDYMVPHLKQNDFYGAINSGTDQIINVLQGKFKASSKSETSDDVLSGLVVAFVIFFIILIFALMNNGNNRHSTYYDRRGKRGDDDFWGGFGGFGGGSFGRGAGGGFGGFGGGGSFGGGGASGSW